jgi:S-adenosylmethionine:diacylglycerol 3-amino-3-carboxypropyl transferase
MLCFSRMYEDPAVEKSVMDAENARCLFICSSGCVALSVLEHCDDKISHIDLVDNNPAQIDYVKSRLFDLDTSSVSAKSSTYEDLFTELRNSKMDFDKVFSTENLILKFGPAAVTYSTKRSFATCFKKIWERLEHSDVENRFRRRFLEATPIENYDISESSAAKIHYYVGDISQFLDRDLSEKYDLISLSNVSDWMAESDVIKLVQRAEKNLRAGGSLVMRRLNSDISLYEIMREIGFANILDAGNIERSQFYDEVLIGIKSSNT